MEKIMQKENVFKNLLIISSLFFVITIICSPAVAVEVELSGHVSVLGMMVDDGDQSDFLIGDNDNSSTRLRLKGEETFGNIAAGVYLELEAQINASNKMTIDQDSDGTFDWSARWADAYVTTPYGQIRFGQGSGAADNTSEVDLSGTSVIIKSLTNSTSQALIWKNSDGTSYRNNLTVGKTRNNFDGLGRNERLLYNSPKLFGLGLSASIANGQAWEFGATYKADLYGNFAAALGLANSGDRASNPYNQLGMSASWLAPFGFNVTAAFGIRNYDEKVRGTDSSTSYYLKVGYKRNIHAVALEYGITKDLHTEGDTSINIGAAYVIAPWNKVELYTALRYFMLDADSGPDPDAIKQIMVGMRIKF